MTKCRYCENEADVIAARIDYDGTRIDVCAAHNPCCGSCRCWKPPSSEGDSSECRRLPPVIVMVGCEVKAAYPDVLASDWCVEGFKPR